MELVVTSAASCRGTSSGPAGTDNAVTRPAPHPPERGRSPSRPPQPPVPPNRPTPPRPAEPRLRRPWLEVPRRCCPFGGPAGQEDARSATAAHGREEGRAVEGALPPCGPAVSSRPAAGREGGRGETAFTARGAPVAAALPLPVRAPRCAPVRGARTSPLSPGQLTELGSASSPAERQIGPGGGRRACAATGRRRRKGGGPMRRRPEPGESANRRAGGPLLSVALPARAGLRRPVRGRATGGCCAASEVLLAQGRRRQQQGCARRPPAAPAPVEAAALSLTASGIGA